MTNTTQTHMYSPTQLIDALVLLNEGDDKTPFAGGSDLMVERHFGKEIAGRHFINLNNVTELKTIVIEPTGVRIASGVTFAQLRASEIIKDRFPVLWLAAGEVGTIAIQNRATIGGNIANASPAGDSLPALLVYDAEITLQSVNGSRNIYYPDFHVGYKRSARLPNELITKIFLPYWHGSDYYFRKVGTRRAQAISKVAVSMLLSLDKGVISDIRLALASVAPFPVRCTNLERAMRGSSLNDELIAGCVRDLTEDLKPLDDIRSTAQYRRSVVGRLVGDYLTSCLKMTYSDRLSNGNVLG